VTAAGNIRATTARNTTAATAMSAAHLSP